MDSTRSCSVSLFSRSFTFDKIEVRRQMTHLEFPIRQRQYVRQTSFSKKPFAEDSSKFLPFPLFPLKVLVTVFPAVCITFSWNQTGFQVQ